MEAFLEKALAKCLTQRGEADYPRENIQEINITFDKIAGKIAAMKKVPVEILTQTKEKKLEGLIPALKSRVVGQDEIIEEIYRKFKERAHNLVDKILPFGCFICLGPTGVGKTEIARALADFYFGGKMVRVDMSEYMESHAAEKLFGAPGVICGV